MEPNALHIWPRGPYMMIGLPNQDRSFTCTCFWPFTMFESLKTNEQIVEYFRREFADAVPLMPTLAEDFNRNPTGSLVTIRCWPWTFQDKAVLLGDAAHAIVPFYGQGMNAAFEDCVTLAECLKRNALSEFAASRKPNTDAIADMALDNFIEMRDHTASRWFLAKKKFGHTLHRLFPIAFTPLYNMVSFSTIPYAQAQQRARRQLQVIRLIACGIGILLLVIFATLLLR